MATVTLKLTTPAGNPFDLTVSPTDQWEDVQGLLERTEKLTGWLSRNGWGFADATPTVQTAAALATGPTFAGYPCSPTVNSLGMPSWIMVGDKQAKYHNKQEDSWYSYKSDDGKYVQVLRIAKGEKPPAVVSPPG